MKGSNTFSVGLVGVLTGALLVSVLPVLAASVGDPLSLGEVNRIDERTDWKGNAKGAVVQVRNTGNSSAIAAKAGRQAVVAKATDGPVAINAKADRVAVKIKVDPGQAPLKVNAGAGTATNLSADLLDGKDSTAFLQPSGLLAVHAGDDQFKEVTAAAEVVRSVTLTAPTDGVVIVDSTVLAFEDAVGDEARCSITPGTGLDFSFLQAWQSSGDGQVGQLAGTRGFDVGAGAEFTANLVCGHIGNSGSSIFLDSAITAIFIPSP